MRAFHPTKSARILFARRSDAAIPARSPGSKRQRPLPRESPHRSWAGTDPRGSRRFVGEFSTKRGNRGTYGEVEIGGVFLGHFPVVHDFLGFPRGFRVAPRDRFPRGEPIEPVEPVETVVSREFRIRWGIGGIETAETPAAREFRIRWVGESRCGRFIGDFGDDDGKSGNGDIGRGRVGGREDHVADGVHLFDRLGVSVELWNYVENRARWR